MALPLLIAAGSIAVGTALGLLRGGRVTAVAAIQWVAVLCAVAVAVVRLLPEAFSELGGLALAAFALPLVLPWLSRKNPGEATRGRASLTLEVGYLALLAHRLADGMLLGTYGGAFGERALTPEVLAAVAAHGVPVSAAIALRFAHRDGRRAALGRALGMWLASAAGVVLTGQVPVEMAAGIEPWAAAITAGLLVQIALHEWRSRRALVPGSRVIDPIG